MKTIIICYYYYLSYQVPRRGTVQLTLFNPQGTVVKMFVILFDLTEMPPNSETFLRQRTFYMPSHETDASPVSAKWLRYLSHLRFLTRLSSRNAFHHKRVIDNESFHIISFQVPQFKVRQNPLAHRHSNDCVAQVGCRHGLGTHCRKLLRMEIVHTRPVQPTLLQPLKRKLLRKIFVSPFPKRKKLQLSRRDFSNNLFVRFGQL